MKECQSDNKVWGRNAGGDRSDGEDSVNDINGKMIMMTTATKIIEDLILNQKTGPQAMSM